MTKPHLLRNNLNLHQYYNCSVDNSFHRTFVVFMQVLSKWSVKVSRVVINLELLTTTKRDFRSKKDGNCEGKVRAVRWMVKLVPAKPRSTWEWRNWVRFHCCILNAANLAESYSMHVSPSTWIHRKTVWSWKS